MDLRKVALECRLRAAEYERKAQTASFHSDRRYYSEMAQQWFVIAEGYETHFAQKQSRSNGQEVLVEVNELPSVLLEASSVRVRSSLAARTLNSTHGSSPTCEAR